MFKYLIIVILTFLIFPGCVYIKKEANLGLKSDRLKYPVSFTSYLYDSNGQKVQAGSENLKILKKFKFAVTEDTENGKLVEVDISDSLNNIINAAHGDGIVNLKFSPLRVGIDSRSFLKYFTGQFLGSLIPLGGFVFLSAPDQKLGKPLGVGLICIGIADWFLSTKMIKDRTMVLVKGEIVQWTK